MMRYIDIGLNLFSEQYRGREEEIYKTAAENDTAFVITGSSEHSSKLACAFAGEHKDVWATAGVHPHDAKSYTEESTRLIRRLLSENESCVAVGECGLDYDRMYSPKDVQLWAFEEQLRIAEEYDRPLFLHERAAAEDFAGLLKKYPGRCGKAVVHCFTGDAKTAETYLSLGCMIGITGWVCDERRNADLCGALSVIPPNRLMAETDGPYLKPRNAGLKGDNRPEYIEYVIRKIAGIKGIEEDTLAEILLENTRKFFGIQKKEDV